MPRTNRPSNFRRSLGLEVLGFPCTASISRLVRWLNTEASSSGVSIKWLRLKSRRMSFTMLSKPSPSSFTTGHKASHTTPTAPTHSHIRTHAHTYAHHVAYPHPQ